MNHIELELSSLEKSLDKFTESVDRSIDCCHIEKLDGQTAETCAFECLKLANCRAFDYVVKERPAPNWHPAGECWLKDYTATPDKMIVMKGCNNYIIEHNQLQVPSDNQNYGSRTKRTKLALTSPHRATSRPR